MRIVALPHMVAVVVGLLSLAVGGGHDCLAAQEAQGDGGTLTENARSMRAAAAIGPIAVDGDVFGRDRFDVDSSLGALWDGPARDVFMVKVSWWLGR